MKKLSFLVLGIAGIVMTVAAQSFTNIAPGQGINCSFGFGELGGGVSFVDFNQDGWDDLTFTTQSGSYLRFYKNTSGTFSETFLTLSGGGAFTDFQETKEAIWVDFDNDGDQDLFITAYNGSLRLLENTGTDMSGNPILNDITATTGIPVTGLPSFGAAWGDYNLDGWLDVYIVMYYPESSGLNRLFRNNGNGTFTDVTSTANCGNDGTPSFDACFVDINNDLYPDIYVANDKYGEPNVLYKNNGDGTFTDISASSGTNCSIDAMNAGGTDYNNDGLFDLYVSNDEVGNIFYANNGNETFSDIAAATGTILNRFTWASSFLDYDNDMDQDLYVSSVSNSEPNAMLVNQSGAFTEPLLATGGLGGSDFGLSYGNATGDLDNDGMMDIAVSQMSSNNRIWLNNESNTNKWIKFKLIGTTSNTEGIGAWIEVHTGMVVQYQYTHCSMGYLGQHSNKYHFGLGGTTLIDKVVVRWPSGVVDEFQLLSDFNKVETLVEGTGDVTSLPIDLLTFSTEIIKNKDIRLHWTTSSERNAAIFEIERSSDGVQYSKIGEVPAVGNSSKPNTYSYLDQYLESPGNYFYRLKMVDRDGSFEYSQVRSATLEAYNSLFVSRWPANPVPDNTVNFEVSVQADGELSAYLYDWTGKMIRQYSEKVREGRNPFRWELGQLPAGSYILQLTDSQNFETIPLIVSY